MTVRRPSKPWRVILTGPDVNAVSQHTSEAKAYTFLRAALGPDSPAEQARVEHWEDGRWIWFDTMTGEDIVR
ncbi:hypothetical protein RVR_8362 [Actinacidiphila reveromycinica]|uniref:Uncharacterized protein n=1 Tax=Actinacidiphila reveromycinica TaxID=659352 RepID=A0A7U3UYQ6_9ACTN|nr:hypothetical protein [Streptomyces sp. SN-593]BBB01107.1 hypothetical protein RVR_8362 [Streptomyces sp. SN-593]